MKELISFGCLLNMAQELHNLMVFFIPWIFCQLHKRGIFNTTEKIYSPFATLEPLIAGN